MSKKFKKLLKIIDSLAQKTGQKIGGIPSTNAFSQFVLLKIPSLW